MASKSENKTRPTRASVKKFVDAVENNTRREDARVLVQMMQEISGEKPVMWGPSIIGFGTYHYKYETGREGDIPRIGFSPRKANLAFYIYCDPKMMEKLGKHKKSVGCMYINKLADVDLKVLRRMIDKAWNRSIKKSPLC